MDSSAAKMYSLRGLPRRGGTKMGEVVRETLICVNASWCSARHSYVSESLSFKSVEKTLIFPAELAMNRQRELILPSNDYSCFLVVGGGALMIARALFSSTSILR
ncbi:hypothetical protein COP2_039118 [Malus domestica]